MSQAGPWRRVLVLGGVRSGKSLFAEQLATECGAPVVYVAAATVEDAEMAERVRRHRERRPSDWRTLEVRRDVASAVAQVPDVRTVLVEDLTLLLSDRLRLAEGAPWSEVEAACSEAELDMQREFSGLLKLEANFVLVSNEVGMGVVPPTPLGRAFRDALGRVNQLTASEVDEVYLLVAGLPLRLKPRDAGALTGLTFP